MALTFLKHERFVDVVVQVIALGPEGKVLVKWWKVGLDHMIDLQEITTFRIDDWSKWSQCTVEDINGLEYEDWHKTA